MVNNFIVNSLKEKLAKGDRKSIDKPEVSKDTKKFLKKQAEDEIVKIEKLTGKDLDHWK